MLRGGVSCMTVAPDLSLTSYKNRTPRHLLHNVDTSFISRCGMSSNADWNAHLTTGICMIIN